MTYNPGPELEHDVIRLNEPLSLLPEKGVYTILAELKKDEVLCVGSLGLIGMKRGYYAYTGSAVGEGALSLRGRIFRHLKKEKRLKWHIDYLTSSRSSTVIGVVASKASKNFECAIASTMCSLTNFIKEFGCSDCSCSSHLAVLPFSTVDECINFVVSIYHSLGLSTISLRFNVLFGHVEEDADHRR